ncbi:hypothetical protein BST81_05490 [Leptolyngbya sp. 'hensonii']|uniref:hypothetical protein n=1 Tax=Leptolyngbya sp. 'hensonii' TaxID=1922337 RepID=UPI0009501C2C|nr:hypothetical protein [Leptolyngbya sp. 'hensonii']OLP19220.1 hypothetical protein BST81_05490 [Leptolyngbya sp. 'hensonii']
MSRQLLRSLLLTSFLSFTGPLIFMGVLLISLNGLSVLPFCRDIMLFGIAQLKSFLVVFGNGSLIRGLLTIGLTCSLVGSLFDTFTLYRYQNLRD